jgi:hypothetical protein
MGKIKIKKIKKKIYFFLLDIKYNKRKLKIIKG